MGRDQCAGGLHVQQRARGAVKLGIGALALVLASLSVHQTYVWDSPEALWTHAHDVAPHAPRPLVNLAILRVQQHDYDTAQSLLTRAGWLAELQPPRDRGWTEDAITVTQAGIYVQQGNWREARWLVREALPGSDTWTFCLRMALCSP